MAQASLSGLEGRTEVNARTASIKFRTSPLAQDASGTPLLRAMLRDII